MKAFCDSVRNVECSEKLSSLFYCMYSCCWVGCSLMNTGLCCVLEHELFHNKTVIKDATKTGIILSELNENYD